jgi:hypothetical protein
MPESQARRDVVGSRREGRRSLSAYNAQARGLRDLVESDRSGPPAPRARRVRAGRISGESGDFSAGVALALVYPLVWRSRLADAGSLLPQSSGDEGASMKRKPSIKSLENVSLDEAVAYLDHSSGDELNAA